MQTLFIQILVGLIRFSLGGVSLWLIQKGIIQPGQEADLYFGVAVIALTVGSIIWSKVKGLRLFHTALAVKSDLSPDEVRRMVNNGTYAPATTPKSATPEIQR